MPRPDAAQILAKGLPNLQHPDGTIIRSMGFSHFLSERVGDEEAVKQITGLTLATAEAIIHLLESNGYTITHQKDPKPVDQPGGNKIVHICCANCDTAITHAVIDDQLNSRVSGQAFIQTVAAMKQECPHV